MEPNPVHLVREEITLPRLLRQAGYATCLTGKWRLNGAIGQGQAEPPDHGFDHWFAAGGAAQRERPLHWHYYTLDRPRSALRDGEWKILGIPRTPCPREPGGFPAPEDFACIANAELAEFELYLARDPGETGNLAAREPARLRALAARLKELHAGVKRDLRRW